MYDQVKATISKVFVGANFISITCDKVIKVDNGSWIFIHAYIVQNWCHIQRDMDVFGSYYLTLMIVDALMRTINMHKSHLANAFKCFGVNNVSTF